MSEAATEQVHLSVGSPPPAPMSVREPEVPDPRRRLLELAEQLARAGNRRALIEYLRLRRVLM